MSSAIYRGLGLWCLTPLSTMLQLHHGGQFYLPAAKSLTNSIRVFVFRSSRTKDY